MARAEKIMIRARVFVLVLAFMWVPQFLLALATYLRVVTQKNVAQIGLK
jgi:hypothetical protein